MRTFILKHFCFLAVLSFLCAISDVLAQPHGTIKLNENALAFAGQLIKKGRVIADRKGAWSKHRPSAELENKFIRRHGFGEYAKWYLGTDQRFPENTKRRYKFPYGDFRNVHRCGVLAVQSRAGEYKYSEIENAAAEIRTIIDATRNATR